MYTVTFDVKRAGFIRLHGGRPPLDGAAVRLGPVLRRFDHVPDDILAYISLK